MKIIALILLWAMNANANFDMTPAMKAAGRGEVGALRQLVAGGANLRDTNTNNASVLYFAAQSRKNSVEIFDFIKEKLGQKDFEALLNKQVRSNGHTVALEAVFNTNAPLVRYLVNLTASGVLVNFEAPTVFGWTPKTFAEREKLAFASELPEGGLPVANRIRWMKDQEAKWSAGLDSKARDYHRRGMALIAAVEAFELKKITDLVQGGVDVNGRYGRLGATPLNSSVRPGLTHDELRKAQAVQDLLLALGANPNLEEGGIMMVSSGFRESVFGYASLLRNMINRFPTRSAKRSQYLNVQGPINGYTKLIDAALRGRGDVIRVLVDAGADTKIQGHNGMTALEAAKLYNSQSATPLPQAILDLLNYNSLVSCASL